MIELSLYFSVVQEQCDAAVKTMALFVLCLSVEIKKKGCAL